MAFNYFNRTICGVTNAHLFIFFLPRYRASSGGVFRRTWFTRVTGKRTVLSIKWHGIAASTADYRGALKWECPKNVSKVQIISVFIIKKRKIQCIFYTGFDLVLSSCCQHLRENSTWKQHHQEAVTGHTRHITFVFLSAHIQLWKKLGYHCKMFSFSWFFSSKVYFWEKCKLLFII